MARLTRERRFCAGVKAAVAQLRNRLQAGWGTGFANFSQYS